MNPGCERAMVFDCQGEQLVGIVHESAGAEVGVVVVVGGPQYRVGSHRQFLLLARYLAAHGVSVLRFDYRGMGDSAGSIRTFDAVTDDIRAAIDCFLDECPGLKSIVLWGLCDAASASLFYAHNDDRVKKLLLLNPWARTEAGQARAYLRHYYVRRLVDPEFWKKLLSGKFDPRRAFSSIFALMKSTRQPSVEQAAMPGVAPAATARCAVAPLPERMLEGLAGFAGETRIIISGDDLTAAEFMDMTRSSKSWKRMLRRKGVDFRILPGANHTFSTRAWRDQVAEWTLEWSRK